MPKLRVGSASDRRQRRGRKFAERRSAGGSGVKTIPQPHQKMENSIQYKESDVTKAIKLQFTDANAGRYLDPWWRTKRTENEISATGFCYMAAWAYHNIMGGDDAGLTVKKFIPQNKKGGHFWVVKQNKERLDLTEAQYPEGFDHYAEGEQSRKPSRLKKKVQEFAKLVREELDRQKLKINPSI